MIKRRLLRINNYLDSKVVLLAKHYNMSINQTILELLEVGLIEIEKKDMTHKQLRNK